ncbi:MAG TPA: baseplate J/gp47 family protein [Solirubrobacteraceae bacterium]
MSADPCGCGCCAPAALAAPQLVSNPPGLPAIGYRIGTYATFREALIEQLGASLALQALSTREPSDYALTFLDSWAYIADILTFYNERTINEAFVRTAKLRDSVVRLAAMVGYDPSPGLAATAPLAFIAQPPASFTLKAGARVQSVPAPGDNSPPVKFETLADVRLSAALSELPIQGPFKPINSLAAGSSGGSLQPGAAPPPGLRPGAQLTAWSPGSGVVELKTVAQLGAAAISWTPALTNAASNLSVTTKTVHVFGYDAPSTFIGSELVSGNVNLKQLSSGTPGQTLGGVTIPYDYKLAAGTTTVDLDAEYPDLQVGDQVLIASPSAGHTVRATITKLTSEAALFGPKQATVTQVTLSPGTPAIADRRAVELHVLTGDVPLFGFELPTQITGNHVFAQLPVDAAPVENQAVVFGDATGTTVQTTVVAANQATILPDHLKLTLLPGLATPLDAASATMRANLVPASQGETVTGELLGSGDASIPGQRFPLAKPPVTRIPHPGSPHGGQSTLVVRVGGVQWTEREWMYGAGADDHVYVVEIDDDGKHYVRFGDGVIGARLPSGAHVEAEYRTGLGTAGNVATGALKVPLTRPKGLQSVSNPIAAAGGADPETLDEARANAPNTVRTFERIVSLQDVEDQARENALVAKAHAAWIMVGTDLGVGLTVAGPGGAQLGTDQLRELRADLDARRDHNRPLQIVGYKPLALGITVRLIATEADLKPEDVAAAAQRALLGHFAFDVRQFGQTVHLSEVFTATQSATGVLGVDVDELTLVDPAQRAAHLLSSDPVQVRIDLAPDELATLAVGGLAVILAS